MTTDAQNKELSDFILAHSKSKSSTATYKSRYKRIVRNLPTRITDTSDKILIDIICRATEDLDYPAETRGGLIYLVILLKRFYGVDFKDMNFFAIENKLKIDDQRSAKKSVSFETVSNYDLDDLMKHKMDTYKRKDYVAYIVNYLLIEYGVRNLDLNVIITNDGGKMNNTDNFLYLRNKSVVTYVRNNYKTKSSYGVKIAEIRDNRFVTSMKKLIADGVTFLLHTNDNTQLDDTSIAKRIPTYTLDKMGEIDYFKIIATHYDGNREMLERYSQTRGTNVETILKSYDLKL